MLFCLFLVTKFVFANLINEDLEAVIRLHVQSVQMSDFVGLDAGRALQVLLLPLLSDGVLVTEDEVHLETNQKNN